MPNWTTGERSVSLKKTKDQLVKLLGQADNNVIALSGKWGTGKTHLWNEVKEESRDEKVKKALYVSLFRGGCPVSGRRGGCPACAS
jgi:chromosomal replication initiation ATPase DnaA